jgi:hypothetical protein
MDHQVLLRQLRRSLKIMRITQDKNAGVITIVTACVLAFVLWHAGAGSHAALSRPKDDSAKTSEAPILSALAAADEPAQRRANEAYGKLPLSFEANQGQTDARVKFLSRGAGYNLFLTSTEAVLSLERSRIAGETQGRRDKESARAPNDVLRMKLVGANPTPRIEGYDALPGKSNYFIGNNPKKWRANVSTFARVRYGEVYPGVDVVYYGNQRKLENDFIVAPGTNPGVIALAFDGASKLSVADDGSLVLALAGTTSDVRLQKPVIYQLVDGVRHEVAGNYVMRGGRRVGFEVAAYDLTKPLVIDPVLIYSTFLGGSGQDNGLAISVDPSGNAYVTGDTASANFPTVNPIQASRNGSQDAFVSKFNAAGSALIYSTYLGGSAGFENGWDIDVDSAGNAYVAGRTTSTDFPVTAATAFQPTKSTNNTVDAGFVTRLSATGALFYSTYLTGPQGSSAFGIATDGAGNAYVTGRTSTGFPVTASAFSSTTFSTGFLTKLNTNASGAASLVYSTFLGPTGFAEGRAIAADGTGNVYITGYTNSTSTNFTSPGAFQTTFGGGTSDAFVAKFNTNLSGAASRIYSTYLGGSDQDYGGNSVPMGSQAIAIDATGNAYVTGQTKSTNFPVANPFQATNAGYFDAFLTKLSPTGSALVYSTYLGGSNASNSDEGRAVAVNVVGNAYVTGYAQSADFPTANPIPPVSTTGGVFVAKFTPAGNALVYSTRLGTIQSQDLGNGIALDGAGNAFVTGVARGGYPTTAGSFQTNPAGVNDVFATLIADPTIIGRVVDEDGAGLANAVVNLTGVPSATTMTDASGFFTFGLWTAGNNYSVAVTASGYIFNSQTVNNLQKNVRLDFSPVVVSIGGQVTLGSGGLSAATMTLSVGKALSTSTDGGGNYSFVNLPAGRSYTVTPSKAGFGFLPTSRSFTNTLVNQTANFVASATIQFNTGSYSASETAGRATITITRTSGASGPASVRYGISDGTALQKSDYIVAFGRLNFAAGETSKSFEVLIVDDAYVEGDEFFFVTLSDPVGATLGTPNPAMVAITDNDTVPPTTNPIDQARFFVQEHYYDFLSRYPDQSGWDFWTNEITSCGTNQQCVDFKRINVSAAYFLSIEFQQTGYLVERMYKATYGDASGTSTFGGTHQIPVPVVRFLEFVADAEQIGEGVVVNAPGWETVLENNKQAFTAEFVQRSRFTTALPTTMTPAQFVDRLNQNAGNVLSPGERTTAINLFGGAGNTSSATARAQALRQVAEDQDLANAEFNRAFVLMQYFGYLRRNPNDPQDTDYSGFDFWLTKLNQFNGNFQNAEMVKAFIVSIEYRQRFGP